MDFENIETLKQHKKIKASLLLNHVHNAIDRFNKAGVFDIPVTDEERTIYKRKNEKRYAIEINNNFLIPINRLLMHEDYNFIDPLKTQITRVIKSLEENNISTRSEVFEEYNNLKEVVNNNKPKSNTNHNFNIPPTKENKELLTRFFNGMKLYFDENVDFEQAITTICSNQARQLIKDKICIQTNGRNPKTDDIIIFSNDVQANEAYYIFEKLKHHKFNKFPVSRFFEIGQNIKKAGVTKLQDGDKKNRIDQSFNNIPF